MFEQQLPDMARTIAPTVGNVHGRCAREVDNCNLRRSGLSRGTGTAAALFLLLTVILPACAVSGARTVTPLKFQTIAKNTRSGVREPLQIVVRSPAEWKALWQKHIAADPNSSPAPAVDFANNIIAAVFSGEKPTGGYAVEIIAAEKSDGALLIYYREMSPRPGAIVTQMLTQPFHMVTVAGGNNLQAAFRRSS